MTRLNIPLFVALAASILAAADARDTLPHQRMIRRRAPTALGGHLPRWEGLQRRADLIPGLGGNDSTSASGDESTSSAGVSTRTSASSAVASSSAVSTTASAAGTTTTTTSAATSSTATTALASSSSSASSSTRSGLLDSLTGILGGTQTSTSVTSTAITSSSVASTTGTTSASSVAPAATQASATSQAPAITTATPTLNLATTAPPATTVSPSVAVITTTAPEAIASEKAASAARTKTITKNTIISLVVVASCIGGAVAIWTVIRKWKLSPSERFDDRMQPIDWAPNGGGAGMREETAEEKRHRRAGSAGSHGSFTSGGVGQSELGHATGARSVYSDHNGQGIQQAPDFPPAHDFTAGTGAYAQYHQGQQQYGYADLQRGPSVTESNYSHGASVTRGLSYSRGGSGGYEAQPGAGGVPPLPNPYGGGYEYEDYGHPAVQGQGQNRAY